MKNAFIIILFFIITRTLAQPAINDTVPDFTVVDIKGKTHHLYNYLEEGKYVCIDFFGTTCDQCIALVPILNQTYHLYGCNQSDLVVLAIDLLHYNGDVEIFEQEYGGTYPAVSGKDGGGEDVYYSWQIQYWPQIVLIHPNKTLISNINPLNIEAIESVLTNNHIMPDSCDASSIFNKILNQKNISLFPNPVQDILYIDLRITPKLKLKYALYNSLGKMISSKILNDNSFIDVSNLNKGIYIIEISNTETTYHQKIIIQ